MQGFWDLVIRPGLEADGAQTIVEVGCESGRHTRKLLAWCAAHGARLHVIDPDPGLDPDELAALHPGHLVFHRCTSLEILERLSADVVLLDGDHNWYTVYHELRALEETHGEDFPLVLLHDVAWPFARRDMYYAPARIPPAYRHAYAKGGVRPGEAKLLPDDGLCPDLYKAVEEGGPRNGVLTAVEDFLREAAPALRFERLDVDFGLGVLAAEARLTARPALARWMEGLGAPALQAELARHAEARRVEDLANLDGDRVRLRRHLEWVVADLGRHQEELHRHEVEVVRLRGMLEEAHAAHAAARSEIEALRGHAAGLEARASELRGELDRVLGSRTWRLTAPLRRANALLRRLRNAGGGPA